jgi:hypothetical protein
VKFKGLCRRRVSDTGMVVPFSCIPSLLTRVSMSIVDSPFSQSQKHSAANILCREVDPRESAHICAPASSVCVGENIIFVSRWYPKVTWNVLNVSR